MEAMTGKHPVDRRRFLQIAGGAAAATALSSSVARAAQIAPAIRTRTVKDVEHIVVLMQENRSFDHYFGSLRGVRGFGDPHPALQPSGSSAWNQSGLLPFHPTAPDLGLAFIEDIPHGSGAYLVTVTKRPGSAPPASAGTAVTLATDTPKTSRPVKIFYDDGRKNPSQVESSSE
jgi:phospholipase C